MVSTRQMTIGNNGSGEGSNYQTSEPGSAKYTRNSAINSVTTVQCYKAPPPPPTQPLHLLDLPLEILEQIFSYYSYKTVCQTRLVSRRIDQICGQILNSTFQRLQNQMLQRFQSIKKKMPRRESARRSHHLACESDIIETLHMRLTLLQMTFGKHIERKHCYFFPGEILDEVYRILHYIDVTPKLDLPYRVTDELFDLSTMAMEYFKEKIEPNLPEIAYFNADFLKSFPPTTSKFLELDSGNLGSDVGKDDAVHDDTLDNEDLVEIIPQSNMVLRKRIRKIKQGMKRYNSQLSILRQDMRVCKRKTSEQQKQISDQQKQLTDQQKQTLEYATRLDEYDKKNEENSRKISTLLQELNKCKTELQYWRCKSPAVASFCTNCGSPIVAQSEELQALINQGISPEGLGLDPFSEPVPSTASSVNPEPENLTEELKVDSTSTNFAKKTACVENPPAVEAPPICGKNLNIKRKLVEPATVVAENSNKKSRRTSKVRSKRVKV